MAPPPPSPGGRGLAWLSCRAGPGSDPAWDAGGQGPGRWRFPASGCTLASRQDEALPSQPSVTCSFQVHYHGTRPSGLLFSLKRVGPFCWRVAECTEGACVHTPHAVLCTPHVRFCLQSHPHGRLAGRAVAARSFRAVTPRPSRVPVQTAVHLALTWGGRWGLQAGTSGR